MVLKEGLSKLQRKRFGMVHSQNNYHYVGIADMTVVVTAVSIGAVGLSLELTQRGRTSLPRLS